jgi:hypothetical protein
MHLQTGKGILPGHEQTMSVGVVGIGPIGIKIFSAFRGI